MKTYIDLHTHSTASDGSFSPEEIIQAAVKLTSKENNPVFLSLTDHDTVSGIESFEKAASKYKDRLTAIPGIEISTDYHGVEIHILGYNIDQKNPLLLDKLKRYRDSRDSRNEKIIQKLQGIGIQISMEDIQPEKPGETIARPHIAKQLMKKKYVASVQEAFDKYLGNGKSCYVERIMPTPQEAITLIQHCGGTPVLAHLMLYTKLSSLQKNSMVRELKEAGLIGIETYHSSHSPIDEEYIKSLAKEWGLIETGGSDFHGRIKPDVSLFTGKGSMDIPETILPEFLNQVMVPLEKEKPKAAQ